MRNRPTGFWQALERIPGLTAMDIEWRSALGTDYDQAKTFLRPNGNLSLSYPCILPKGCGCQHDVITHASDEIVAVCRCEKGCKTLKLQNSDIVIYEIDRAALCEALVKVLVLFKETDTGSDLPHTTLVGVFSPYAGFQFPVFLTIQFEPVEFSNMVDGLQARNDKSFILLAPTRDHMSASIEKRLTDRQSIFIPLFGNVTIAEKRQLRLLRPIADILSQFNKANHILQKDSGDIVLPPPPLSKGGENSTDQVVITRKEVGEEVHWIVNGDDKGRFFTRADSKKARIIDILYDQIGRGWVPHKTFMNATGWNEKEYFRSFDNSGRMQKQLTEIRDFLKIAIEFRKERGVRFNEGVVKSE